MSALEKLPAELLQLLVSYLLPDHVASVLQLAGTCRALASKSFLQPGPLLGRWFSLQYSSIIPQV